jgi:putative transposase
VTVFRFVEQERAHFPVATMCRVLAVSASGYWAWRGRAESERARTDRELAARIETAHTASRGTYGSPRIHADLRAAGTAVGRKRVARLMREQHLQGVSRRRAFRTTRADPAATPAPDLVGRRFAASAPDRLWVADITELPTAAGPLFLAAIVDAFSRACVGWSMADHLRSELVETALGMALARRRPGSGLVHHSDHGSQYTSVAFGKRCADAGIVLSMGSVGDSYDNAMAESFFASLETELIDRTAWRSREAARRDVFDYLEAFYNPYRRHSALGYVSPLEFERRYRLGEQPTAA